MTTWIVSPTGTATGAGTIASPLDMVTAIGATSPVSAGDTVYLRYGTYSPLTAGGVVGTGINGTATAGKGVYTFLVNGAAGSNIITFRNYPGEAVRINGAVHVVSGAASYITFRGIEIASTPDTRSFATSAVVDYPSIYITGTGCKFIDCYLHDLAGINPMGTGGFEMHGCLLGWIGYYTVNTGTNRDYDIYTHNHGGGNVLIENNCFMPAFGGYGIHAYSPTNDIRDYYIQDNIAFDACLSVMGASGIFSNNHLNRNYCSTLDSGVSNPVACIRAQNEDTNDSTIEAEITYNYLRARRNAGIIARDIKTLDVQHNTIIRPAGTGQWATYESHTNKVSETWNNNTYHGLKAANNSYFYNWDVGENEYWDVAPVWNTVTGFDANSTQSQTNPAANYTAVIKSDYSQRGFVAIYNWESSNSVTVDISSLGLTDGARCRYYNCSNPAEYVDFTYDTASPTLTISMLAASWTMRDPTAYDSPVTWYAESFPDFGAFLVEQMDAADMITVPARSLTATVPDYDLIATVLDYDLIATVPVR